MRVYLLRHAIAEDAAPGQPDRDRALVPEGRKKLREVLAAAKSAGVAPSLIVTSPYRRAEESAQIAAKELGYRDHLVVSDALIPGGEPADVWTELRSYQSENEVMLVGHEPLFGQLFAYLLGTPTLAVDFKKGALARIDLEQFGPAPRGVLRWFLAPKLVSD